MTRGGHIWTRALAGLVLLAAFGAVGGCELLYLVGPHPKNAAAFKFPKKHRVLVLVELRNGVGAPPSFTTALADAIGAKLWQSKSVDAPLIRQDQLLALQQANPSAYAAMHLGDIARAVGADDILSVYITQLQTNVTADGSVGEGGAEAYVKVLDHNGDRVWPGEATGRRIIAQVTSALLSDRDVPATLKALSGQLADHTDALFHETPGDERHIGQ